MSENKPTYEELLSKLAETEGVLTRLSEKLEAVASQRDSALLGSREMEEAYIESEQNFRNAMDASPLGIRIVTEEGELIYANQAILDICGYGSVEELKAVPRQQLYTPESYAAHQERKEKRKRGEHMPPEYEISIRRSDGAIRNLQVFRREVIWGGERQFMAMYRDISERKKAEEALRQSEEKFAKAFHASPDLMAITDLQEGRIIDINDAYCRTTGYNREELTGHTALELNMWAEPEQRNEFYQKINDEGQLKNIEIGLRTKTGDGLTLLISAEKINLHDQPCLLTAALDITARKKAEEALLLERDFNQSMFDTAQVIMLVLEPDGRISTFNSYMEEISGYKLEEVKGKYWFDIFIPERDRPKIRHLFNKAIDNVQTKGNINAIVTKDGREREIEWYDKTLKDPNGKVVGLLAVGQDVTERKRAEEELRESERKLKTIFEILPVGVSILDVKRNIAYMNPALERILDISSEGLLKGDYKSRTYLKPDGTPMPAEEFASVLAVKKQKAVHNVETGVVKEDGNVIWTNVSAVPVAFPDWKVVIVTSDITERKRVEEVIRESEEKYRSLFKNMLNGYAFCKILVDEENKPVDLIYIDVNDAFEKITGLKDVVGKKVSEVIPGIRESDPEIFERYGRVALGGEPERFELYIKSLNVWHSVSLYSPAKGFFVSVFDVITERKQLEEDLKREREEIKLIIDSSPILIFYKDKEGKMLRVNKAFAVALNMPEEDFLGKTVFDLYSAEIAQGMTDDDNEVLNSGSPKLNIIEQYESARGLRWVETDKIPILDKSGKAIGLVGFAQDITERRQLEESIRYHASLIENVSDAIVSSDQYYKLLSWNKAAEEMYGWREEEVIGKTVMEVTKPVFVNTTLEDIQKLLRQNGYWKGEAIHQRKDGGKINVLISISLMKDAKGNEQGAVTIFTDITERKHMEQALRESEEKFSRAFLASPEIIAISRLEDSLYLEVNDSFVKTTGYTREELIGHRVDEINMWVNPKEQEEMARLVVENGYIKNKEYSLRMKSGEVRQWLCSSDSINIGGKACSIAVAADITERKQAEERINHLVLTLRSIRNVNQLITREKDCDRLIQGVCDSLVESHSFGSAWIVLLDESQQPITWATANGSSNFPALIESFRQGNPPRCAQKALKQKQAVVTEDPYTMCPGCPILGGGTDIGSMTIKLEIKGHIYGVLCASMQRSLLADKDEISLFKEVATDIAFALRDIELGASNELLEQERLRSAKLESIGTLAGGIAHDFNNLLTGIMGNIGLAKTSIQPSDATFEMLDEAEKAAVRAKDLTQQLLTFAKGGKPVKKPVEIAGLVKESAAFALRGSNVRLELSLPDDLWSVEADEGQIGQVINNLVINADEAMPSGGILKIEAGNLVLTKASGLPIPNGNYVHIGIRDTGIGISQEHLQRIFEPYFTTKQKGSGLGLTTVYSIVRNHGGYILAESRQNKGSTFHIYLPALKKAAKGGRKVAKANTSQAGGKVLVMDDEEIIRKMLKSMLSLAGYEVVLSADGKEALGKYTEAMQARDPFDVVIMDLTIPGGMGGKEAIKKLLEIDPNATVIVSSGYATDPIMSEYRKHGFKAVIAKPYSVKQLRETLSGITRKKKQAD